MRSVKALHLPRQRRWRNSTTSALNFAVNERLRRVIARWRNAAAAMFGAWEERYGMMALRAELMAADLGGA